MSHTRAERWRISDAAAPAIADAMENSNQSFTCTTLGKQLTLRKAELQSLLRNEHGRQSWLGDNIISILMRIALEKVRNREDFILKDPGWVSQLEHNAKDVAYRRAWMSALKTKLRDNPKCRHVIFARNEKQVHWQLFIWDLARSKMYVLDPETQRPSLPKCLYIEIGIAIGPLTTTYLKFDQPDRSSCGVVVCASLFEMTALGAVEPRLLEEIPSPSQSEIGVMRAYLAWQILNHSVPDPTTDTILPSTKEIAQQTPAQVFEPKAITHHQHEIAAGSGKAQVPKLGRLAYQQRDIEADLNETHAFGPQELAYQQRDIEADLNETHAFGPQELAYQQRDTEAEPNTDHQGLAPQHGIMVPESQYFAGATITKRLVVSWTTIFRSIEGLVYEKLCGYLHAFLESHAGKDEEWVLAGSDDDKILGYCMHIMETESKKDGLFSSLRRQAEEQPNIPIDISTLSPARAHNRSTNEALITRAMEPHDLGILDAQDLYMSMYDQIRTDPITHRLSNLPFKGLVEVADTLRSLGQVDAPDRGVKRTYAPRERKR